MTFTDRTFGEERVSLLRLLAGAAAEATGLLDLAGVMSSEATRDEASVKRFQREVQAAARLEYENIVTAYASGESGESGDVKNLVMQFVDGGDLSQLVKRDVPLPVERDVDYVLQTATGLAYAHRDGVIHRAIKPANMLLGPRRRHPRLVLEQARPEHTGLDFGS